MQRSPDLFCALTLIRLTSSAGLLAQRSSEQIALHNLLQLPGHFGTTSRACYLQSQDLYTTNERQRPFGCTLIIMLQRYLHCSAGGSEDLFRYFTSTTETVNKMTIILNSSSPVLLFKSLHIGFAGRPAIYKKYSPLKCSATVLSRFVDKKKEHRFRYTTVSSGCWL